VLWFKPYVFYPPREFGPNVQVKEYVEAMQFRNPGMLVLNKAEPPTPQETEAASDLVDGFLQKNSLYGILALYACHLGLRYTTTVDIAEVFRVISKDQQNSSYLLGFLVGCNATGLISLQFNDAGITVTPISMNATLRKQLADDLFSVLKRKIDSLKLSDDRKQRQLAETFARCEELNEFFIQRLNKEELTSQSSAEVKTE
jgi:hypothetical protein